MEPTELLPVPLNLGASLAVLALAVLVWGWRSQLRYRLALICTTAALTVACELAPAFMRTSYGSGILLAGIMAGGWLSWRILRHHGALRVEDRR